MGASCGVKVGAGCDVNADDSSDVKVVSCDVKVGALLWCESGFCL